MNDLWLLHRLQQIDNKLTSLKAEADALVASAEITKAIAVRERKHRDGEVRLRGMRTALKDAELKLATVTNHRKSIEAKLYSGTTTNPKELSGFAREAELLAGQQGTLEEQILAAMEEIEAFVAEQEALLGRLGKARQALEKEQAAHTQKRIELDKQSEEVLGRRQQLTAELSPASLNRYETLRKKKQGVAVTLLKGSACGDCGTSLPEPLCRRVRERQVELCTGCERILFAEGSTVNSPTS